MKPITENTKKRRARVKVLNRMTGLMEGHEKIGWMLRAVLEGRN